MSPQKKNQPTEEPNESTTSIAPKGVEEIKNAELNKEEAEQIAGGFSVRPD